MSSRFRDVRVHMERCTDPDNERAASLVIEEETENRPKRWMLHLSAGEVVKLRDELNCIIEN